MNSSYKVVHLLRNQLYPTYQLHAYMANKKTAPQDGLRLAALVTMHWLRLRLGEHAPEQFQRMPEPSSYMEVGDDCLFSLHVNAGYVIDIVSLPEQGLWSMQVTEPDLGSDPGNADQKRPPVAGRIIETNVAYKIVGQELECGFQTIVSDPEGTSDLAEVYRLAIVRKLISNQDFGLKQIKPIVYEVERIVSVEQIKTCQKLLHSEDAHLPLVVFSQIKEVPQSPSIADISKTAPFRSTALPSLPNLPVKGKPSASDPPYDMISFARSGVALCRTYLLEENLRERFNRAMNCNINPGDVGVFEPRAFGNYAKVYPFKPSNVRQEETMASLRTVMYQYPRKKEISFGRIIFLSAARESLLHLTRESKAEALTVYDHWAQKVQMLETYWAAAVGEKDAEISGLSEHLSRQKQYVARLEEEKEVLRGECAETLDRLKGTITARDEEIAYLRRKINQPKSHSKVANWVETTFSDRLILHARAAELLEEKSARSVSIELICDALDFLATDYWDRRYTRISSDEMFTRCSQKYGHPFEVKPTGKTTIEFTPNEYKIKYYTNTQGKLIDSNLDYHLGVGNDPENLLRIYFLHDDERKLIVVGSLPRHLRSVTIK